MAAIKNNDGSDSGKKESAYPLYPLDEAIKIAEAVRDMGGSRASVSKALLAKHMKYAETGPSFVQRIAAAKTYGLIDGWGTYALTDQAKRYFYPTHEDEKSNASLSFLSSPAVFKLLIDRFDGDRLPTNEMIGNVLHQEARVPTSWKDRLASMFVRGAQSVGIIDADGFLRYNANMHESNNSGKSSEPLKPAGSILAEIVNRDASASPPMINRDQTIWAFKVKGGGQIRLETPEEMTKEVWDKLNAYVQILKPSTNDGESTNL